MEAIILQDLTLDELIAKQAEIKEKLKAIDMPELETNDNE